MSNKRIYDDDLVDDEEISNLEPLFFVKPKKVKNEMNRFKPISFKSMKDNKFDFESFNKDYVLNELGVKKTKTKGKSKIYKKLNEEKREEIEEEDQYSFAVSKKNKKKFKNNNNNNNNNNELSIKIAKKALNKIIFPDNKELQVKIEDYLLKICQKKDISDLKLDKKTKETFNNSIKMYVSLNDNLKNKFTINNHQLNFKEKNLELRKVCDISVEQKLREKLQLD